MQHDGIVDGIVSSAEGRIGTPESAGSDLIIAVVSAYHREQYAQGERLIEAVDNLTTAVKGRNNYNGSRKIKDRVRAAAPPLITGGGIVGLLVALVEVLA